MINDVSLIMASPSMQGSTKRSCCLGEVSYQGKRLHRRENLLAFDQCNGSKILCTSFRPWRVNKLAQIQQNERKTLLRLLNYTLFKQSCRLCKSFQVFSITDAEEESLQCLDSWTSCGNLTRGENYNRYM